MRRREKMSSVDTAWLRMDRPTNLMMIVGVLMFEGRIDFERLKATIATRLAGFRRFRQRVVIDAAGAWWEDDAEFRIDRHVSRMSLPQPAGKEELERLAATMIGDPLDDERPLWAFTLVENYRGGSALVARIHHCIADGIALIGVMLELTDRTPDGIADDAKGAAAPSAGETSARGRDADGKSRNDGNELDDVDEGDTPHDGDPWRQMLAPVTATALKAIDVTGKAWSRYLDLISEPAKAAHYAQVAGAVTAEVARLLSMPDDSPTRFKGKPGRHKAVAWSEPMPLAEVKAIGHVLGASVNDVLLASVAGAFGAYLSARGDHAEGVEIRALIPVNLRREGSEDRLGNRFGLVTLELPLGVANPFARLAIVRERMEALKGSYQAPVTLGVLSLVGLAPEAVQTEVLDLLAKKATAVMTNVPGPQQPLYMAGGRLAQMMFWVPQSCDIGIGVSILSYDGGVQFGLVTDRSFVADPQAIVDRFAPEFDKLLLAVLMLPRAAALDPDVVEDRLFGGLGEHFAR